MQLPVPTGNRHLPAVADEDVVERPDGGFAWRVLDYVVLVVEDLDRSIGFYNGVLGLPLAHRAASYAQLVTGTTRLGLFTRREMAKTLGRELSAPRPDAPSFELGFKVAGVDEAYDRLMALGVQSVCPPVTRPWGQRTAYVADPDGHLVELAEDLDRPRPGGV